MLFLPDFAGFSLPLGGGKLFLASADGPVSCGFNSMFYNGAEAWDNLLVPCCGLSQ